MCCPLGRGAGDKTGGNVPQGNVQHRTIEWQEPIPDTSREIGQTAEPGVRETQLSSYYSLVGLYTSSSTN